MIQTAVKIPAISAPVIADMQADVLKSIWSDETAIAIYRRHLDADFQQWLADLPAEKLPSARLELRPDQVKSAIMALCDHHEITHEAHCETLAEDVSRLATLYAGNMSVDRVNLRFDVVNNNACRKFHQDNVAARLLCTYRGRGTQYGEITTGPDPDDIHELSTGEIALFRGRQFPGAVPSNVYHRSPPIEGSGETRLLLVIDNAICEDDCCI